MLVPYLLRLDGRWGLSLGLLAFTWLQGGMQTLCMHGSFAPFYVYASLGQIEAVTDNTQSIAPNKAIHHTYDLIELCVQISLAADGTLPVGSYLWQLAIGSTIGDMVLDWLMCCASITPAAPEMPVSNVI